MHAVIRGRAKKLIVAFHFYKGNQAAWRCDTCRPQGLDTKRRCGFLPVERLGEPKTVWVGGGIGVTECPKSLVSAQSLAFLEAFFVWKVMGGVAWEDMWSKQCDAFLVLEQQLRKGSEA